MTRTNGTTHRGLALVTSTPLGTGTETGQDTGTSTGTGPGLLGGYSPGVQGKHAHEPDHEPVHETGPGPVQEPAANQADREPGSLRRVRLTPASRIRLRPTYWLWDERIPHGALVVGPGREGIGKSLFCAWLAARVTLGELPGVHHGQPQSVIYAATEDSWERTLAGRLVVAGADMNRVYRVEVEHITGQHVPLSLPKDCDALATEITRHQVGLLIVDPLISAVDASLNTNQDPDLRRALEPLARLADDTGASVFGLAHFNKATGADVLTRIMGGRAFASVSRAAIAFARDTTADDGSCVISQVKNNLGRLDLPSLRYHVESVELDTEEGPAQWGRLVMLGETDTHVNDLLDETPARKGEATEREEICTWLREFLTSHDGSAPATEVIEQGQAAGMYSKDQLKRAKTDIGAISIKTGAIWLWQLPNHEGKGAREQERKEAQVHP